MCKFMLLNACIYIYIIGYILYVCIYNWLYIVYICNRVNECLHILGNVKHALVHVAPIECYLYTYLHTYIHTYIYIYIYISYKKNNSAIISQIKIWINRGLFMFYKTK